MAQGPCWMRSRHLYTGMHLPFSMSRYKPGSPAACQHVGFSSCLYWPHVAPTAGKYSGQWCVLQPIAPSTAKRRFTWAGREHSPGLLLLLFFRAGGAGTSLSLCHSAKPMALIEQTRADQTLSDDLSCTFFPSPKCSFVKSANFAKLGQLQQARQCLRKELLWHF